MSNPGKAVAYQRQKDPFPALLIKNSEKQQHEHQQSACKMQDPAGLVLMLGQVKGVKFAVGFDVICHSLKFIGR